MEHKKKQTDRGLSTNFGRRRFLQTSAALGVAVSAPALLRAAVAPKLTTAELNMEQWNLSKAEWRKRLTPEQFRVLREHGTERAFTSPLDKETRAGTYHCAGCDLPLFKSDTKYDSGTGWPSFYAPIDGHVGTSTDYKLIWPRTEVHCERCKGHQGHVFNDGPAPTGKRYCINGVALDFKAA